MPSHYPNLGLLLLSICLCCHSCTSTGLAPKEEGRQWGTALEQFFGTIDKDGDGQIEPAEALQYIDANFEPADIHQQDASRAVQQMSRNLDGSDSDATISKEEVETHLKKLLKGNRVAEWLKHSAQMPQYVRAFRENSITSLDFPMLVADGGVTLETDLGVKSKLHREQITRALKRVILGIGATPTRPRALQCKPVACDSIVLLWQPPERLGQPPMHKYKLERQKLQTPEERIAAPVWQTANGELDDEATNFVDSDIEVGTYHYRLTAWNALGWSEYEFSAECNTANTSLPCPPEKCWEGDSCKDTLSSVLFDSVNTVVSGEAAGSWRLACTIGGVAVVSLLMSTRFMSEQRRRAWQEFLQKRGLLKLARLVGLSQLPHALIGAQAPPHAETDAPGSPASISPSHSRKELGRGMPHSVSFPELNHVDSRGSLRLLQHSESNHSHGSPHEGGSGASTPRRKSQVQQKTRSDYFFPGEVESYRHASEAQLGMPLSKLRVPVRRATQPGLLGEQEVVWLDDEGMEVSAPPALDIPPSPGPASRHGCAFPGCDKSLHPLFNPRSAMTSHYCSICQNMYCQRHTAYSPHGRLGSCGMESKCICQLCYDELPRVTQERLEKTNRLQRSRKDLTALHSNGSASTREKSDKLEKGRRAGASGSGRLAAGSSSGSLPLPESPSGARSPLRGTAQLASGREQPAQSASGSRRSGAQQWAVLRTAWRAAMRFRGAGNERRMSAEHGEREAQQ